MTHRKYKTTADADGVKHTVVATGIRSRIAQHEWAPGLRLPSRRELQREFNVSPPTVESAMRSLRAEGYIRTDGRLGTYVTDNPPCFSTFGLVFPWRETPKQPWVKFWHALEAAARQRTAEGSATWVRYYDDEGRADDGSGGNEDYDQLLADTLECRVGGLLFVAEPFRFTHTPLIRQHVVPMSAVTSESEFPNVAAISPDNAAWLGRALDTLKDRKCRRIAVLTDDSNPARCELFISAAAARGLKLEPYAVQSHALLDELGIKQCVHLLGMLGPALRPDGLIVTDDNLIGGIAAGLAAAGLAVPRDIEVVAHWNFPLVPPQDVPFHWLGFDAGEILKACRKNLGYAHTPRRAHSTTAIPPRFAGELVR